MREANGGEAAKLSIDLSPLSKMAKAIVTHLPVLPIHRTCMSMGKCTLVKV